MHDVFDACHAKERRVTWPEPHDVAIRGELHSTVVPRQSLRRRREGQALRVAWGQP